MIKVLTQEILDQCVIRENGVKWMQMLKGRGDSDMDKDKGVKCWGVAKKRPQQWNPRGENLTKV